MILDTLARHRGVPAHRTDEPLAAQRDAHNDTIRTEPHAAHPHPLQAQQTTECGSDAHGPNLQLEELEYPRAYGAARARRLPLRQELRTAATSAKPAQDSPQITLGALLFITLSPLALDDLPVLTLKFTLSRPEFLAISRRMCVRRWPLWLPRVVAGIAFVAFGVATSNAVAILIGAVIAGGWLCYGYGFAPIYCWRKLPHVQGEQVLRLSEEAVTAELGDVTSRTAWDFWRGVSTLGDGYVLRSRRGGFVFVPSRAFATPEDEKKLPPAHNARRATGCTPDLMLAA